MTTQIWDTRQRFGASRTRGGCATCRSRRVKCDENRPSCRRCVKADRACGFISGNRGGFQESTRFIHYVANIDASLYTAPDVDWRERRCIHIFHSQIAVEIAGSFCSELWSDTLLLVASKEDAIRHAIVALSALYEHSFGASPDENYVKTSFAVQQYNKAIQRLINQNQSARAIEVALLGCIIFASIEGLQSKYDSLIMHTTNGLNLLAQYDAGYPVEKSVYVPRLIFRQQFVRMKTQMLEHGNVHIQQNTNLNTCRLQLRSEPFESLHQAKVALSSKFNQILSFLQNPANSVVLPGAQTEHQRRIMHRREILTQKHVSWCQSFADMSPSTLEMQADVTILALYRTFLGVILRIDLNTGEKAFDSFEPDFQEIVFLASAYIGQTSTMTTGERVRTDDIAFTLYEKPGEVQISDHSQTCSEPTTSTHVSYGFLGILPAATPVCHRDQWPKVAMKPTNATLAPSMPKPGSFYRPSFSMGLGIVVPLFVSATRCRNFRIRRQALQLLRACNRKEGLWDSRRSAKVAECIIEIEEDAIPTGLDYDTTEESDLIPEHARLWQIYCRLPFGTSKAQQDQIRLRRDVVRLKRELAGISAQDDFARWAKLRRQHDKAMEEHDRKAATVSSQRSGFDTKATVVRWTCTSGLRFAMQFWHSRTPLFTYPRQWFPWYIEWALAFPRCPSGGISINVWSFACATVIALASDLIMYALQYVQEIRSRQVRGKVPVAASKDP